MLFKDYMIEFVVGGGGDILLLSEESNPYS